MKKLVISTIIMLIMLTTFNGYSASTAIDPLSILENFSVSTTIEPINISESISIQLPEGYSHSLIDETLSMYYRDTTRIVLYKKSHAGMLSPEFRTVIMNVLSNNEITNVQEKRLADLYDDTALTFSAYNDCIITDISCFHIGGLPARQIRFRCDDYGRTRYGVSIYFLPFDTDDVIFLIGTDLDEAVIVYEMDRIMDGWTATLSEIN